MDDHRSLDRVSLLLASFCLALSSGFLSGRLVGMRSTPLMFTEDKRPRVPTVRIDGVRNGLIHGSIIGNARVVIGDELFTQSGVFVMDAGPLLYNEIAVVVPDGARFVASVRGKKYYPVFSSAGERITPKNRIYFATEQEAESAGYLP